jgi:hypothetical protein
MIARDIVIDINSFVEQCGGANHDWYVGVTADAEHKLFDGHKVNRQLDSWVYRIADNSDVARNVKKAYLALGFDGANDGAESTGIVVYAYLKSGDTTP